jgi:hypothetical protein
MCANGKWTSMYITVMYIRWSILSCKAAVPLIDEEHRHVCCPWLILPEQRSESRADLLSYRWVTSLSDFCSGVFPTGLRSRTAKTLRTRTLTRSLVHRWWSSPYISQLVDQSALSSNISMAAGMGWSQETGANAGEVRYDNPMSQRSKLTP